MFTHPAAVATLTKMLSATTQTLKRAAAVQGRFVQRTFLHDLPQPLQSSGDFLVARGLGVDWHTLKPFDAATILTPSAVIQRAADGHTQVLAANRQPGLHAIVNTFDALFTLDLSRLARRFSLFGVQGSGGWTLGLKPRAAALAAHLTAVVVTGGEYPRDVTLYQAGGDRTEIRFVGVSVEPHLDAAQRKRFEP
ncbi:MAG TPA: outer membrane lipoprotein carrier protein LolA [Nevskiaceae bacterium]|nr:outer membrane lipoprotein carrier protein LolA [Nevskiaceae bacterium]